MRTGAIFARGSCRALKWMALFGVMLALGGSQAVAQETLDTAVWTPESAVVTVTMSGPVWTQAAPASDFTVTWTGPTGSPATGVTHTIAGSVTTASNMFTINLDKVIPTSAQGVTVTYTDSGAAATPVNPQLQILDTDTTGYSPVGGGNVSTVNEMDVNPTVPSLASFTATYQRGTPIAAFNLPDATGNGNAVAPFFTYAVAGLPATLTFTADPDSTPGNADDRQIAGTPTAVTAGPQTVTYLVTDRDGDSTAASFMITVADVPATPVAPTVAATPNVGGSLDVSWGAPAPNNSPITDYEIQHRQMGAATWMHTPQTGTGTMMTFPNLTVGATYQFQVRARNTFGWSNWSAITTGIPNAAPLSVTVSAAPMTIAEGGTSTITAMANRAVLASDPAVTVNLSVVGDATLSATSITIAAGAQSGTVTLTSTADTDFVNDTVTVVARGTGITGDQQIAITVTDPPPAAVLSVTVSAAPMTIAEGGTSTITAMANRAVLASDPAVTVNLSVVGDATLSATSITIAAGAQSGTVTLTSTEDADYEDDTVTVTASGTGITGNQEVEVTVTDNDTPPTTPSTTLGQITEISVDGSEEKAVGGTKRQHVTEGVLTKATVTVRWSHAQIRELWAGVAEGSKPADVPVMLEMTPVDSPESWLSEAEREAGHDDVTIGTAAMVVVPKNEKPVTATSVGQVEGTGSTSIHFGLDPDAENEAFKLMVTDASGFAAGSLMESKVHVIEDINPQNIVLKRDGTGVIYEGRTDVKFDVTADPPREDLPLGVRFDLEDVTGQTVASRDNYIDKSVGTIPTGTGSAAKDTVTLTLDSNDGNRDNDKLALHAEVVVYALDTGAYDGIDAPDPVEITVVDVHKLPPLTVSPKMGTLTEGGEVELTLTINRNPPDTIVIDSEKREYTSEPVDVMLTGSPDGMVQISPRPVKFPKHDGKAPWTQEMKVMVEAMTNDTIDGDRMVMITAEGAGTIAANGMGKRAYDDQTVSLTVTNSNERLVWARSPEEVEAAVMAAKKAGMGDDMTFTAGEMIELEGNDLFGSAEGVSVGYTAMVEGDAVSESVSGGVVTITADSMGMGKVTITARASRPSGAVVINDQTDPREASITITLEVGLEALSIMLSGPEDMNLVEGMSAEVTATANRAVTADTMVMLMRDRAMSSAGDADYEAEAITISAGELTGSTMVMAVEDNVMENDGNMAEELVLYGMAADNAGEVTGHVKLYLWDAAVPALPVIAQLLLAAFLAIGGYRRYLRRR